MNPTAADHHADGIEAIGVTGLGPIGRSLARNLANRGLRVVVHNRTESKTSDLVEAHGHEGDIVGTSDHAELVAALEPPRVVLCLVKAGSPVDAVIDSLVDHLESGDVIVDGGNSDFRDTDRRAAGLAERGIRYLGMGVSGGEKGALEGPSLMVGGDRSAYDLLEDLLGSVAAHVDGEPCRAYLGPGGAGHYVKTIHNGIEYAVMQAIAEAYDALTTVAGMDAPAVGQVFRAWNDSPLGSYLIEITARILRTGDPQGEGPLVDRIADRAAQKGTGRLTAQEDLELGTAGTTIAEAVSHRSLSALTVQRRAVSATWGPVGVDGAVDPEAFVDDVAAALLGAVVTAYAQGFALLAEGGREHDFGYRLSDVATIWRGGCIVRARLLEDVRRTFAGSHPPPNLLADRRVADTMRPCLDGWRRTVALAHDAGVPVPVTSSALSYLDALRRGRLPTALVQAQRDVFGAHTYERVDRDGHHHADWLADPVTETRTDP